MKRRIFRRHRLRRTQIATVGRNFPPVVLAERNHRVSRDDVAVVISNSENRRAKYHDRKSPFHHPKRTINGVFQRIQKPSAEFPRFGRAIKFPLQALFFSLNVPCVNVFPHCTQDSRRLFIRLGRISHSIRTTTQPAKAGLNISVVGKSVVSEFVQSNPARFPRTRVIRQYIDLSVYQINLAFAGCFPPEKNAANFTFLNIQRISARIVKFPAHTV